MNILIFKVDNGFSINVENLFSAFIPISVNESLLIESVIRSRYSISNVEAIINNYLEDNENKEYVREFKEMQEWRKKAKLIAREVMSFIIEEDLFNKPDGMFERIKK